MCELNFLKILEKVTEGKCKFLQKTKDRFNGPIFIFDFCVNKIMRDGKKEQARKIFIKFFHELTKYSGSKNTFQFFLDAIYNVSPRISKIFNYRLSEKRKIYMLEETTSLDSIKKGLTFFIEASLSHKNRLVYKKFLTEILDASVKKGKAFNKRYEYEKKILHDLEGLEIKPTQLFLHLDKKKFAINKI